MAPGPGPKLRNAERTIVGGSFQSAPRIIRYEDELVPAMRDMGPVIFNSTTVSYAEPSVGKPVYDGATILHPLQNIAVHVIQTEGVGWKRTDGRCVFPLVPT